ncbi:HNH endonuclease signature motif containing protein [Microbacterium sp. A93]|uniref:HNH endonuclease signature motif containing protein n=1 Tax=Microbacterium sp. A93 TaxID=3450716 RepID=UPI003F440287
MEPWFDDVDDRPRDAAFVVESVLVDLQCADIDLNRHAASRAARIADAVALARRNPELYALSTDVDAVDLAERGAIFDIALRLKSSEDYVRGQLHVAEQAQAHLPMLWRNARDGFASMYLVSHAVGALLKVRAPAAASKAEREAEREAFRRIDEATAEWSLTCTPQLFLQRLRRLVDKLMPESPSGRHAKAVRDRRVVLDHRGEGMTWFGLLISTEEAVAAYQRADESAKKLQQDPNECRTRAQIRADLCSEWLRGIGTSTAVQTKVFITIPVQLLSGDADADANVALPEPQAELVGHGPIDPLTAKQILLDIGAFRRVIVDPIDSVILDMERRSRRATPAQKNWLILQHGTCARDGCTRLAQQSDIDHEIPWSQGGKTNIDELRPLCPRDHVNRHLTRAVYRSRPDRTVEVTTPTGHRTRPPTSAAPPF